MLPRFFLLLFLPVVAFAAPPPFDVLDYTADLRLDLAEKSLRGEMAVTFESTADSLSAVELDAPGLTIEALSEKGVPVSHEVREGKLRAVLERPAAREERRTLKVRYAGKPEKGMRFGPDQVFTSFNTSRWLVSRADPGDKATLTLALTLPADLAEEPDLPRGRLRRPSEGVGRAGRRGQLAAPAPTRGQGARRARPRVTSGPGNWYP